MNFNGWWRQAVMEWEIPANVSFYPFVKMATGAAWNRGYREGCMDTTKIMTLAQKEREEEVRECQTLRRLTG